MLRRLLMSGIGRATALSLVNRVSKRIVTQFSSHLASSHLRTFPTLSIPTGYLAFDMHLHTPYSHDAITDLHAIFRTAAQRGLSGIAITDHDTISGGRAAQELAQQLIADGVLPPRFMVIVGAEISSKSGHIIGLFLTEPVRKGLSTEATIEAIHAQGGIAVAAHPLMSSGVGMQAHLLPFDGIESQGFGERIAYAIKKAAIRASRDAFYAAVQLAHFGGSDAHTPDCIGFCYTLIPCAPTPEAVRAAILARQTAAVSYLTHPQKVALLQHGLIGRIARYGFTLSSAPYHLHHGKEPYTSGSALKHRDTEAQRHRGE